MNEIEKDFFDNTHEKAIVANTKTPPKWCPTEREYREQCGPVKTTSALPDLPTFRDRLSWLMAREGQNKTEAAKFCGINRTYFSKISTGNICQSPSTIKRISDAYKVQFDWLSDGYQGFTKCDPLEADAMPKFQLRANGKYHGSIIKQLVLGLIDDDTYQINMTVEG